MKINEKDRGQLLRMAGNIACGLVGHVDQSYIAVNAATIAIDTLKEVDRLIALNNEKESTNE